MRVIKNMSFENTWVDLCKKIVADGRTFETEYGNKARYLTVAVELDRNAVEKIEDLQLHFQFPTRDLHLRNYIKQFTDENVSVESSFSYTYFQRLKKQLAFISENLKKGSRRQVAITWIPNIDISSDNPPCLIYLNLFVENSLYVRVYLHWRSRDVYNAYQSNLCGIVYMLNAKVLKNYDLKIRKIIEFIDNAHVYEYNWRDVEQLRYLPESPQERYY